MHTLTSGSSLGLPFFYLSEHPNPANGSRLALIAKDPFTNARTRARGIRNAKNHNGNGKDQDDNWFGKREEPDGILRGSPIGRILSDHE